MNEKNQSPSKLAMQIIEDQIPEFGYDLLSKSNRDAVDKAVADEEVNIFYVRDAQKEYIKKVARNTIIRIERQGIEKISPYCRKILYNVLDNKLDPENVNYDLIDAAQESYVNKRIKHIVSHEIPKWGVDNLFGEYKEIFDFAKETNLINWNELEEAQITYFTNSAKERKC